MPSSLMESLVFVYSGIVALGTLACETPVISTLVHLDRDILFCQMLLLAEHTNVIYIYVGAGNRVYLTCFRFS
eukprot:5514869-Amphidinium_carterae.2